MSHGLNWFYHFNSSSTMTPKDLTFPTRFIPLSLSLSRGREVDFIYSTLLTNSHKLCYLGFPTFSLFTLNQSLIFTRSFFAMLMRPAISLAGIVICISSVYMFALENFKQLSKSLRYIMKIRGPT